MSLEARHLEEISEELHEINLTLWMNLYLTFCMRYGYYHPVTKALIKRLEEKYPESRLKEYLEAIKK